jgi:hypothetical protein
MVSTAAGRGELSPTIGCTQAASSEPGIRAKAPRPEKLPGTAGLTRLRNCDIPAKEPRVLGTATTPRAVPRWRSVATRRKARSRLSLAASACATELGAGLASALV